MDTKTTKTRDSLNYFGGEMMVGGGARAVAAWQAMRDPDWGYAPEDVNAPYALRALVDGEIGIASGEGLPTAADEIERYRDYIDLRRTYGSDWPVHALPEYLSIVMCMGDQDVADECAQVIWCHALGTHEELRKKQRLWVERSEQLKQLLQVEHGEHTRRRREKLKMQVCL